MRAGRARRLEAASRSSRARRASSSSSPWPQPTSSSRPRGARLLDVAQQPARGRAAARLLVEVVRRPPSRGRGRAARRPPAARAAGSSRSARRRRGRRARPSRGRSAPSPRAPARPPRRAARGSGGRRRCRIARPRARRLAVPPPYTHRRAAPLALRRRSRLQRGAVDPRRGRADARPARGAGPPVGADRGRQREPGRHRRPARAAARRRAHPGPAQRRQPRQGLLRAPRHAGRARRPAAALRRRLRGSFAVAAHAAGRDRRGRRRRRRLAARRGRAASAAASRCGAGSSGARSSLLCRAVLREPTSDLFCGFKLWRADAAATPSTGARSSTAGPSTPRRSRSPARSASACARSGSSGTTARARGCRWLRVLVPVVRELAAARRHVRREVARPGARVGRGRELRRLTCARSGWRWARWHSRPSPGCCCASATKGGYVAGGDGFLVLDQMQYLNWLRQSGSHLLIGNLYDLAPGPRTFLHPGLLISGALNALGVGPIVAYVLWKPVAVLALWAGASPGASASCRSAAARGGAWRWRCSSPRRSPRSWAGAGWGGFDARFDFDFLVRRADRQQLRLGLLLHRRSRSG